MFADRVAEKPDPCAQTYRRNAHDDAILLADRSPDRGRRLAAEKSLDSLFETHPASSEAADGAELYSAIEATMRENDQKWDAAVDSVRSAWEETTAEAMRADLERQRGLMETNLSATLATRWETSKAAIRKEWEAQ